MTRPSRSEHYGWAEPMIGVAMVAIATAVLALVAGLGALLVAWVF